MCTCVRACVRVCVSCVRVLWFEEEVDCCDMDKLGWQTRAT